MTKFVPFKSTVKRAVWLLVLLLATAALAYPVPLNWILAKSKSVIGVNLGPVNRPFVLGLDLQGGTHLEYEADVSKVPAADRGDALAGVRDVIERRVNAMGVSEPFIQTAQAGGAWRVTVELAGISDITKAIKLIGDTPILEFKEQNEQTARPMTVDEKKTMDADNAAGKKKAEGILAQALKSGGDFKDIGFILGLADYKDIYDAAKDLPAGTVLNKVLERSHAYTVVKVTESKTDSVEVSGHQLLISYKGAEGNLSTYTKEQALAKIQALKAQATTKNFDTLVQQNSQEPGAAESKGDLGWFASGTYSAALEKVVLTQPVGTVSEVIETPLGYHLVWKMAERPIKDVRVSLIETKKLLPEDVVPVPDPWKTTKLSGKDLKSARVDFDQRNGNIQVALQFSDDGAKLFADITKRNVGKPVAIFLDGQPISVPTVQNEILGGQAVITGNFSLDEAKTLARRLQAGALPVPIKLIAQQTVGPTLGADSLTKSLAAGLIGFLLVALYMIVLYRLPGLISIIALGLYGAVVLAIFKLIPVTLTLSGIAGFVLSLGIAVDANVLQFERLKEEWREGKNLQLALEAAFRRAWLSIRDGHMTVLISCIVLYWFSSSLIRGFALTLAIGTLISLFTAVVSARTILRLVAGTRVGKVGWLFLKPRENLEISKSK